ncbi:MAG: phosphatidylserine decarboxylase family protein [Dysgonamonadaceae bacterium]|jgi:phosphatidylserine decarboxylase|nr:phosphatidylserine decarboxylase family protein [Dysgonamonadaceae bacterium]
MLRIHKEGKATLSIALIVIFVINIVMFFFQNNITAAIIIFVASAIVYGILLNFFREPKRIYEGELHGVVNAPTDGKIVVMEKVFENKFFNEERIQVSIFMNVFNAHANWMPVTGKIAYAEHIDGNYHAAYLPKSSHENERSEIVIETPEYGTILTKQIAGAIARRIVMYVNKGDNLSIGAPLGFIKFGSRMDVFLPIDSEILVKLGDSVRANETILAHLTKK